MPDKPLNDNRPVSEGLRVGAVSFFNARPLTFRLDRQDGILLERLPPARLACGMDAGRFHAALVPSIDYQRPQSDWLILPIGAIGSDGPVLTVRVFSKIPFPHVQALACDTDSHTSVALAQEIWHLRYRRRLRTYPLDQPVHTADTVLLIGDKVLSQLGRWPHELDLGAAWAELTDLPFVYAFWAVRSHVAQNPLLGFLQDSYRQGAEHIAQIVTQYAGQHGFEPDIARRYLTENIRYHFGPREKRGLLRFFALAYQLGLTSCQRSLRICGEPDDPAPHAAAESHSAKLWPIPSA